MTISIPVEEDRKLLALMANGMTNDEIAVEMQLPLQTLKSRVRRLMIQYGARNRTLLVSMTRDNGEALDVRPDVLRVDVAIRLRDWTGVPTSSTVIAEAFRIAFRVRNGRPAELRGDLRRMLLNDPDHAVALLMSMAALVPLDESPDVLLRWLQSPLRRTTGARPDDR
jgi:DNA-binding CsgD family transcriptional regulator